MRVVVRGVFGVDTVTVHVYVDVYVCGGGDCMCDGFGRVGVW